MRVLATWSIERHGTERVIELLYGDIAHLPADHHVDVVAVSAFPDDYTPAPGTVLQALHQNGVSVRQLAGSKQLDMRHDFSSWLSKPISGNAAFRHILCIESRWRGTLPQIITDDIFGAIAPLFLTDFPNGSLAMPILGTGNQGWPVQEMLECLLLAAVSWIERGLALKRLKLVVFGERDRDAAVRTFVEVQQRHTARRTFATDGREPDGGHHAGKPYDVFFSYAHEDYTRANMIKNTLQRLLPTCRMFYDRDSLAPGRNWLLDIGEALDTVSRVVVLFTPQYWSSGHCKFEFAAALARQLDCGEPVLFPVYMRTTHIPYAYRNIEYIDCREEDTSKLDEACVALSRTLAL
jgi:hypothetical protein